MPLEAPILDSRTFDELFAEARLRIPRYTPEWTDFNDSDPGITLLQLFAWLTELQLYELNRVPERSYIKFLQLIGLELDPAQPADADLVFTPRAGADVSPVPERTQVSASPPAGGPPLIFETESGLGLVRVPLTDVRVFDGQSYTDVSAANEPDTTSFPPFGWTPQIGNALYLGFTQSNPAALDPVFPEEIRVRAFLPGAATAGAPQSCSDAEQTPAPPVNLVWEYMPSATAPKWERLDVFDDGTAAFTRDGYILLAGPAKIEPSPEAGLADARFWLRCRLASGSYPTGVAPSVDFVRTNVVPAVNLSTVSREVLGQSSGRPGQSFTIAHTPVVPASLQLQIEVPGTDPEPWQLVDDFLASGPTDPHYVLNATTGTVTFGDGKRGEIPVASADVVAQAYRYGGGAAGNVPAGSISSLITQVTGVDSVTNPHPAVGGRDEQSVDDLKQYAPRALRTRNRAVSADDFVALAEQAGGVARATALPLAHPDHPGVPVPGAVTVVIVPDSEDVPPRPSSDLIRDVCRYLDQYRLLTTEVYVKGPAYQAVSVQAVLDAESYAAPDTVALGVRAALDGFFDPLGRAQAGAPAPRLRAFGEDLFPTNLFNVILGIAGVADVASLSVTVDMRPQELTARIVVPPDGLLYGTGHEITVKPRTDQ